jgi:hypothetical protein
LLDRCGSKLEVLAVNCRSLTSEAAHAIGKLLHLRELDIYGMRCDESILRVLRDIPSLKYLELAQGDFIPTAQIDWFESQRPDVEVVRIVLDRPTPQHINPANDKPLDAAAEPAPAPKAVGGAGPR